MAGFSTLTSPLRLVTFQTMHITVPKVGILNYGSGFRWTAVLESVQRNPLTNAVTLQSIPLFGDAVDYELFLPACGFEWITALWIPLWITVNSTRFAVNSTS